MTELELIFEVDDANEIEHTKNTDDLAAIVRGWIAGFFDETNITSIRLTSGGPFTFRMFHVASKDGTPKFGNQRIYYSHTDGDDTWHILDLDLHQELEMFRQKCSNSLWERIGKIVVKDEIDKTILEATKAERIFGLYLSDVRGVGQNFDEVV